MAHTNLETIRIRYQYCCGYCGVSEIDSGGELTIDHYHPVSAGGDDSEENLIYACIRCNQYKSDYFPDATRQKRDERILHPQRDDISIHIREEEITGLLEALTTTGAFHIERLRLNRPALVAWRRRRTLLALSEAILQTYISENAILRTQLEERERRILELERRFGLRPERNPDSAS